MYKNQHRQPRELLRRGTRIVLFQLSLGPFLCSMLAAQTSLGPATLRKLESQIVALNKENRFSGAVSIAKDGEVVFEKAIGWANFENQTPVSLDTRFKLGSGSKMFTAIAIAQLVHDGMLNFDDPIIKHLTEYPNREFASRATVHQLLTHTSGLGDYWDDEYEKHWHKIKTLAEIFPFVVDKPLLFQPGDRHSYSNSGYIVLGLIIEAVTGLSYYDYVRKHIYEPADMLWSDSYKADSGIAELAVGYRKNSPADDNGSDWHKARHTLRGSSAGGSYSTLGDMLKFHRALQGHKLLSREYTELLQKGKAPLRKGSQWKYGYGFIDGQLYGYRHTGHGGFGPGIFFQYRFFPTLGYTVILFANRDSDASRVLFDRINELITDRETMSSQPSETTEGKWRVGGQSSGKMRFSSRSDAADSLVIMAAQPGDDERFGRVVKSLATAMNDENLDAYQTLFAKKSKAFARSRNMFDFMVGNVMPLHGNIERFHALGPPVRMGSSEYPMRPVLFHLEDGYPGYYGIALNKEDQIVSFSLFIKSDLCPNGVDFNCDKVTEILEEEL